MDGSSLGAADSSGKMSGGQWPVSKNTGGSHFFSTAYRSGSEIPKTETKETQVSAETIRPVEEPTEIPRTFWECLIFLETT